MSRNLGVGLFSHSSVSSSAGVMVLGGGSPLYFLYHRLPAPGSFSTAVDAFSRPQGPSHAGSSRTASLYQLCLVWISSSNNRIPYGFPGFAFKVLFYIHRWVMRFNVRKVKQKRDE